VPTIFFSTPWRVIRMTLHAAFNGLVLLARRGLQSRALARPPRAHLFGFEILFPCIRRFRSGEGAPRFAFRPLTSFTQVFDGLSPLFTSLRPFFRDSLIRYPSPLYCPLSVGSRNAWPSFCSCFLVSPHCFLPGRVSAMDPRLTRPVLNCNFSYIFSVPRIGTADGFFFPSPFARRVNPSSA